MTKMFCPHCGNKTLKKIAVTINEDGSTRLHFSRNPKVLNPKGLKVRGGDETQSEPVEATVEEKKPSNMICT